MSLKETKYFVKKMDNLVREQYRKTAELDRAVELLCVILSKDEDKIDKDYVSMAVKSQHRHRQLYLQKLYDCEMSDEENEIWTDLINSLE